MSASNNSGRELHNRVSGWLPHNHERLEARLLQMIEDIQRQPARKTQCHPAIKDFKEFIEGDPDIAAAFRKMFDELPLRRASNINSTLKPQVGDYMTMLSILNNTLTTAPPYDDDDVVLLPIYGTLYRVMGTPTGFRLFTDKRVNFHIRRILDVWSAFLTSSESRYVLTDTEDGWLGPKARKKMPRFEESYVCDPSAPYHGFASWDDFFTRRFRPGVRPVASPDDDIVINSPCECTFYRLATGIKRQDRFWVKGEPYSLDHMLDGDARAEEFVGGTAYQATLGPTFYHRWHSPVNGTIVGVRTIPGTYYAEFPAEGSPENPDVHNSQAFSTATNTRALIFIQADSPEVGLMCFVAVGLVEVSTCEVTVKQGERVKKGDQLGMFHFGGSTFCLLFRKAIQLSLLPEVTQPGNIIHLNSKLAVTTPTPTRDT